MNDELNEALTELRNALTKLRADMITVAELISQVSEQLNEEIV